MDGVDGTRSPDRGAHDTTTQRRNERASAASSAPAGKQPLTEITDSDSPVSCFLRLVSWSPAPLHAYYSDCQSM